ncbi:MAG: DUF6261 family protein [Labilibaculum antarcticum]
MFRKMIFSLLRINELLGYCNEITNFLKSIDMEGLQIITAVEKFSAKYQEALAASNRSRSSVYTNLLHGNDARRDESFIAFRNLMEASTHRRDESVVLAAENICRIIRGHTWSLQGEGQKVESAKMASLKKELDEPVNQEQINHLDANSWYRDMVEDNKAFNQLKEDKVKAKAAKIDYDTEKVYRELRFACTELLDAIEVLNRIAPNGKYTDMASFINDCTQKYMIAARTRKTKSENADAEIVETEAK